MHVGDRVFTPSVTDLASIIAPKERFWLCGDQRRTCRVRNDLSLKNDFTFVLARLDPEVEAAVSMISRTSKQLDLPQ